MVELSYQRLNVYYLTEKNPDITDLMQVLGR